MTVVTKNENFLLLPVTVTSKSSKRSSNKIDCSNPNLHIRLPCHKMFLLVKEMKEMIYNIYIL